MDASGFALLADAVPDILQDLRYYTTYNFIGRRVDGYEMNCALLAREAADTLRPAAERALRMGYRLKVLDAYRPQRAVDCFVRWVADEADDCMKPWFYPETEKSSFYELDFIGRRSAHSRGSAVDLTLVDMRTGADADMGGPFDFFGPRSRFDFDGLTPEQAENRRLLRELMTRCGFLPLEAEWWHFRLKDEPFPDTYFDFPVRWPISPRRIERTPCL